ncbi:MAG TPA: 3-phosphoshikimate 1-carboxyvinyltransferase [Bacillota bacterium]
MTDVWAKPGRVRLRGPAAPPDVTVAVPGSKSLTNRALLLAALAEGESRLEGVLWADDTRHMRACLERLGVAMADGPGSDAVTVGGVGGRWRPTDDVLFVGNAGTAARFLTAALALSSHGYRLDGDPRMRQRPIRPLLMALQQLGALAVDELGTGAPPVRVRGPLLGGEAVLEASASSQFVSALLMVLPLVPRPSRLRLVGEVPARPYVAMTLALMRAFGVAGVTAEPGLFTVEGGARYTARTYRVEPDASSASYFFAAAALTGGRVTVVGMGRDTLQGDAGFVEVLAAMGCRVERGETATTVSAPPDGRLRAVSVDLNAMSDMTPTLAALAPFADGPVRIDNVGHIRVQESDRLHALATELARLGIRVEERADGLTIYPGRPRPALVQTYNDHRLAMAFSVLALRAPGVEIADPGCVAKTFPDFYQRLAQLGVGVEWA